MNQGKAEEGFMVVLFIRLDLTPVPPTGPPASTGLSTSLS
jgi:hypothetical protein